VHVCFDDKGDIFRNNIVVLSEGRPAYRGIRAKPRDVATWDYNLYWTAEAGGVKFIPGSTDPKFENVRQMNLQQWQAVGLDEHSLEADPMFRDPDELDFQVKPGSPALKLGFKNFPMDRFGVTKPQFRKLAAEGHRKHNAYLRRIERSAK
ncbi:MAG: hypothetical protein ACYSYM_04395, partial [Planctomycetota bacterium]